MRKDDGSFGESLYPEFCPDGASRGCFLAVQLCFSFCPRKTCARFHGRSPNRLSFSPFDASYLVYRLFLHFLANPSRKHFPRYWRTCPSSTTLLQSSHCASNFERKPRRERERTNLGKSDRYIQHILSHSKRFFFNYACKGKGSNKLIIID